MAIFVDCIRREKYEEDEDVAPLTIFAGCCVIVGIYGVCRVAMLFANTDQMKKEKHPEDLNACREKTEIGIGKTTIETDNIMLWEDACRDS